MTDGWGYVIAAVITGTVTIAGWLWKTNEKGLTMRQRWAKSRARRRRVKAMIQSLPDLEVDVRAFAQTTLDKLDGLQTTINANTRKIAAATSFAAGAFEASSVAQCIINDDGAVEDCNTALLELMHAQKHQILGMQWKQFLTGEHVGRWMKEHEWMVRDARGRQGQSKVRAADGTWLRLRFSIVPRFEVGDPVKIFHVFLWPLPPKNGAKFEDSAWSDEI